LVLTSVEPPLLELLPLPPQPTNMLAASARTRRTESTFFILISPFTIGFCFAAAVAQLLRLRRSGGW